MTTKAELERQIQNTKHKSFAGKMWYLLLGLVGGWLACYIYVVHFSGQYPPAGTFWKFLRQSWLMFGFVFIPILQALVSRYIKRRFRNND